MKVMIFSGSTGGHLFPALSFANYFREQHRESQISYVVSEKISPFLKGILAREEVPVHFLPPFPLASKSIFQLVSSAVNLARAFAQIPHWLEVESPDLVVGFGSYVSWPGLLLARSKGIPCFVHEQNVELGKANRYLSKRVDKVAVSFRKTLDQLPLRKGILTGNLVRPQIIETIRSKPRLRESDRQRFLVLGGSQGARFLNETVIKMIELLRPEEKKRVAVIHIAGASDIGWVREAYRSFGVRAQVFGFCEDMASCYAASDVVISRAGAGALTEIALFGLPSILIPYPYARSHQRTNARYFFDEGGAFMIEQKDLSPDRLKKELLFLLTNHSRRAEMGRNVSKLACPDAAERMVKLADTLLGSSGEPKSQSPLVTDQSLSFSNSS